MVANMAGYGMRGVRRRASPQAIIMIAWLQIVLMTAACTDGPVSPPADSNRPISSVAGNKTIFVVSNGFHSSVMLSRSDIMSNRIPEAEDFPLTRYLEFGWGDAEYYPAQNVNLGITLRAALLPTPAVLHVAASSLAPSRRYPEAEVIPLSLDEVGMQGLVNFIDGSFQRAGRPRANAVQPGLYADSLFYAAVGRFHLANTCHTWTTRALKSAGFRVEEGNATDAESLMSQVRRLKEVSR
jgi:uncharacterized protein (TIGR02117 family)